MKYVISVLWRKRFVAALVFFMQQYPVLGLVEVGNRNTFEGGAQQRQSYIYQDQVSPFDSSTYPVSNFFGNVEFRGGLIAELQVYLAVTPPISGSIQVTSLDNIFYLWNDLTLNGSLLYNPGGSGSYHKLYIISQVASGTTKWGVNFASDVTIGKAPDGALDMIFYFNGDPGYTTVYDGNHYKLILTPGSQLMATSITFKDITVMNAENLLFRSGSSNECVLQNVTLNSSVAFDPLHPSTIFTQGIFTSLAFRGMHNVLNGGGAFSFRNTGGIYVRIARNSKLYVAPQTTLMLGTSTYGSSSTYIFDDATSVLYLDNCTVFVGNPGEAGQPAVSAILKKGTVYINGTVTLKTVYGSYLQLGDGVDPANNCTVVMLPGAKLSLENYNDSIWAHTTYGAVLVNKNV
jgi:hypothetical protein